MNLADKDAAWAILIETQQGDTENRTAFLAALIMDRCGTMNPRMAEAFATEFVRLAKRIKRHAENECNREVTESEERRDATDQTRFGRLATALGFEARTGGDPRGACAYLIDPQDRRGDGWGEGFAVYA